MKHKYLRFHHNTRYIISWQKKDRHFFYKWPNTLAMLLIIIGVAALLITSLPPSRFKAEIAEFNPFARIYSTNQVTITGNKTISKQTLLHCMGLTAKSKIDLLLIDLRKMKATILQNCKTVNDLTITATFYPSLLIQIEEKTAKGLLWLKGSLQPIDSSGELIQRPTSEEEEQLLPIISGNGARKSFFPLLESLKACGLPIEMIHSMTYIKQRRWNLLLKDYVKIKLPEHSQDNICRAVKLWNRTAKNRQNAKFFDLRLTYLNPPLIYYH